MSATSAQPQWNTTGAHWPNRQSSRFEEAGGLRWHVQEMGQGGDPKIVLIHGTGAATHSFRDLAPLLADTMHVLTFDLPGHGFTSANGPLDLSLPGMTNSIHALLSRLDFQPDCLLGHSAGAAIAIQYALDHPSGIERIFAVNGALNPIKGYAVLSPMAKLLFANSFSSRVFSATAAQSPLGSRLIEAAGPQIDQTGRECYNALMKHSAHVQGALGMMASWQLGPLLKQIGNLEAQLVLIAARDDKLVPITGSLRVSEKLPDSEMIEFADGGHLLHEVRSAEIAQIIKARCTVERGKATVQNAEVYQ